MSIDPEYPKGLADPLPATSTDAAARIEEYFAAAREGALLVIGEPGVGKSFGLRSARRAGDAIVRATRSERAFPLSGVSALVGAVDRVKGFEIARRIDTGDGDDAALRRVAYELLEFLLSMPVPPGRILVDNLDDMDDQSLRILAMMCAHLTGTGISLVMAATRAPAALRGVTELTLVPLGTRDSEIVARTAGAVDDTTMRIVLKYCGGYPATIQQHVRSLSSAQLRGERPLQLPPTRQGARTGWSWAPAEFDTLLTVAVAPECPERVAAGAGDPDVLSDLIDRGLLVTQGANVRVNDQRLRSAALGAVGHGERRHRHAKLAVATAAVDAGVTAWHRTFVGWTDRIAGETIEAAIAAVDSGRMRLAVELMERAFTQMPEAVPGGDETMLRLVRALMTAGEASLASRYAGWSRRRAGDTAARAAFDAVWVGSTLGSGTRHVPEEVAAMTRMHRAANPTMTSRMNALLALDQAMRAQVPEARRALGVAREFAATTRAAALIDEVDDLLDAMDGRSGGPREVTGDEDAEVILVRAAVATYSLRFGEARGLLELASRLPGGGTGGATAAAHMISVLNDITSGDLDAAGRGALRRSNAEWIDRPRSYAAIGLAWRLYALGSTEEAVVAATRAMELAERESNSARRGIALAIRAAIHFVMGDLTAALSDLRAVAILTDYLPYPALPRYWGNYIEVCLATGNQQEARQALASYAELVGRREMPGGELVLDRARALLDADPMAALSRHIAALTPSELQTFHGARSLLSLADAQSAAGRAGAAERTAAHSATVFEACGAPAWARCALVRMWERAPRVASGSPLDALNDEERMIAGYVSDGLRNREIAHRLFLSVRTIELRLTGIYRMVGVRSRSELAAVVDAGSAGSLADAR